MLSVATLGTLLGDMAREVVGEPLGRLSGIFGVLDHVARKSELVSGVVARKEQAGERSCRRRTWSSR